MDDATPSARIGRLERLSLRSVWKHEAHDFTRWLQENIDLLEDAIGIEFGNADVEREQPAGRFKVDLVTTDARGRRVIIENQFENSNHDHLGKLITYAAAYDADVAIWVCEVPRPEHTEAVNWLNKRPECDFYLVRLEAVRIGESAPAANFTLISGPSEVSNEARTEIARDSELGELQFSYWSSLLAADRERRAFLSSLGPQKSSWIAIRAGIPRGCALNLVVGKSFRRVEIYIDIKDEDHNKHIFDAFVAQREKIEKAFGRALDWQPLEGKRACRVCYDLESGLDRFGESDEFVQEHIELAYQFFDALKPSFNAVDKVARSEIGQE
ncbi:MAG: DUF4268 domain-containing protein [Planctomycetes bacterium]|nr:DUF4268 domain-containing protein [Planctomycetota bacterium]